MTTNTTREHEWQKVTLTALDAAMARKMGYRVYSGQEVWFNEISMSMCPVNPNDPDRYPTLIIKNLQDWRKDVYSTIM